MNPEIKRKYLERKKENAKKTSSYVDLSDNIAISILEALKRANINKTEFAKKIGKDASVISRWLNGQHNFTVKTIVDIENTLNQKIIFTSNKINQTKNIDKPLVVLRFDSIYKNKFSKLTREKDNSEKKVLLSSAYKETLTFDN